MHNRLPLKKNHLILIAKVVIPLAAFGLVWNQVHEIRFQNIEEILQQTDTLSMALGGITMLLAICVMGFYDVLAFQVEGEQKASVAKRWLIGATTFGWSNLIGFGPAIRAWLYSRHNFSLGEITKGLLLHYSVSFAGLGAWVSSLLFIGEGFYSYTLIPLVLSFSVVIILKYLFKKLPYAVHLTLDTVPLKNYLFLALVSFFDWGLTLTAFYFVVDAFNYAQFDFYSAIRVGVFGWFAGLVSMVPGGLGTADAVWLHQFNAALNNPQAAAALVLAVRLVLYVLPWFLAAAAFYYLVLAKNRIIRGIQRQLIALIVASQSAILLFSVATPYPIPRLEAVATFLPLHFIEGSHIIATLFGFSLLFLLRGINRGYKNAYKLALTLLTVCLVSNIINGLDLFALITTSLTIFLLFSTHHEFTREGNINISVPYNLLVGALGLVFLWVMGFVAFDNVPYKPELWHEFSIHMQASRFLRSAAILTVIYLAFTLRQAFRTKFKAPPITEEEINKVEVFVQQHGLDIESFLVAGGDKYTWWYENVGFILYQISGNKLLVFKNPQIVKDGNKKAFLQAFMSFCDANDLEPYFSGVSPDWMEHLHQFGFYFTKFAEEAIVDIEDYNLQGHSKAAFRRTIKQVEKKGFSYDVLSPPFDENTIDQLRAVSDEWLQSKGGHELQFNACYFSPAYVQRNPVAVVKSETGEIIAFVNMLTNLKSQEGTFDFMRYKPAQVDNLMDYLLVKTFLHLSEQGYKKFSLGNAPMTDVGNTHTARSMEKIMLYVSEHAEHFYNYSGLRFFKGKFKPNWEARFLAYRYPWNSLSALKLCVTVAQARSKAMRRRIAAAKYANEYSKFT